MLHVCNPFLPERGSSQYGHSPTPFTQVCCVYSVSPRALSRRWARALSALALLPILMAGHEMAQARAPIAAAAWLAGCWSADGKDAGSAEQWMAPAGGSMLGLRV